MPQSSGHSSPVGGQQKELIGGSELRIEEHERKPHVYQSNAGPQSPVGLDGGGDISKLDSDLEATEFKNEGKSKNIKWKDDGAYKESIQESSVYHAPYHGGRKSWESHDKLVFLASKEREQGPPQAYDFSDQDEPDGPLLDIPDITKLRLWRLGTSIVNPVEEIEAATKTMIDAVVDQGKNERAIREKDRDIESIKNYVKQLKTMYDQEIYEKNAEIQTLKVRFKGSLSPLQPYYLGQSEPEKEEYEQKIQKKNAEIQALKASLKKSLPHVQGLSSPGTQTSKPSKPTKTATILEIANRTNKNLLKARAGLHIISANNFLWDEDYREAHESAFRAEKLITDNELELDSSYARTIFYKAQAEYGLGRLHLAAGLFEDARRYGIDEEQIDAWIKKCDVGDDGWPNLGYYD